MPNAITRFLAVSQYPFLNGCLYLVKKSLYNSAPKDIRHLLIVRKGTLGDIIVTLPIIHAIRELYPNAQIHLLSKHYGAKHIAAHTILQDGVIQQFIYEDEENIKSLFHKLKIYDMVIELPQYRDTFYIQLRNMIFFRLAGIHYGAGWEVGSNLFLRKIQLKFVRFEQETKRLFHRLQTDGLKIDESADYSLQMDIQISLPSTKYVALAIGAKFARKQWPIEWFLDIAQKIKSSGYDIIWLGDAADGERLKAAGIESHHCGKFTVAQSAFAMQHATCALTNDSGPMHLAYAVDTPVIGLFSARDYPNKWFPPEGKKSIVFQHSQVPCAICVDKPCNNNICMKAISVDEVWNQLKTWIN